MERRLTQARTRCLRGSGAPPGLAATRGAHSLHLRTAAPCLLGGASGAVRSDDLAVETDRTATDEVHVLACAECPRVSSVTARGWKGYRTDEPRRTNRRSSRSTPGLRRGRVRRLGIEERELEAGGQLPAET